MTFSQNRQATVIYYYKMDRKFSKIATGELPFLKIDRRHQTTVCIDIFTQYIFSCILHGALNARIFDVYGNYHHNSTNRINWYVCENLTSRIYMPPRA